MKKIVVNFLVFLTAVIISAATAWAEEINVDSYSTFFNNSIDLNTTFNVNTKLTQQSSNSNDKNTILGKGITINGNGSELNGGTYGGFAMSTGGASDIIVSNINNIVLKNYGTDGTDNKFVFNISNKCTLNLTNVNIEDNNIGNDSNAAIIVDGGKLNVYADENISFSETKKSGSVAPDFSVENGGTLSFFPQAGTDITIYDGITGNGTINIGDVNHTGNLVFNGTKTDQNNFYGDVKVDNATIKILKEAKYFESASHTFNNGTLDIANNGIDAIKLGNLTVISGSSMKINIDVDLAKETSDKIETNTNTNTIIGNIILKIGNLIGDTEKEELKLDNVLNFTDNNISLDPSQNKISGSLYTYDVVLGGEDSSTYLTFKRAIENKFNAKILQAKVANAGAGIIANGVALSVLNNSGNYTLFHKHGINGGDIPARDGLTMWVKGFGGQEKVDLENYTKVDTTFYGGTVGIDTDRIYSENVFATYGLFASYAGGELKDDDNKEKVIQNGGYAGLKGIWYAGRFFISALANYGMLTNKIESDEDLTDFNSQAVSAAAEIGFNWEAESHSITLQPNIGFSASYLMTDEYYLTSGGKKLKVETDDITSTAVTPGLRIAKNLGRCWILNIDGKYVITSTDGDVKIDNVLLPDMNYGNYTNIGLGVEKIWGYTVLHLKGSKTFGGRDGVMLNAGIEFKF